MSHRLCEFHSFEKFNAVEGKTDLNSNIMKVSHEKDFMPYR